LSRRLYGLLGATILTVGATMLALSLLVLGSERGSVTAIAILILGLVFVSLSRIRPSVPPVFAWLLGSAGHDNMERLIEHFGLHEPGVYLPSTMCPEGPRVVLPLDGDIALPQPGRPVESRTLVQQGPGGKAMLVVVSPGSYALGLLEEEPGSTLDEATVALTSLACSTLGLAAVVRIGECGRRLTVTFERCHMFEPFDSGPMAACLGSPLAGIAATVLAETLRAPVRIDSERLSGADLIVTLEPAPTGGYE
jgi:hypothetical protein